MRELVYSPTSSESSHITQRGIGTLLDLFVLHRSEVLRLIVLYLFRASSYTAFLLIFQLIFIIGPGLSDLASRFDVLQSALSQRNGDRVRHHSKVDELKEADRMHKVVLSLDDIANGIINGQLSAAEVKRALQRILLMDIFCESAAHPSDKEPLLPTEEGHEFIENGKFKGAAEVPQARSLCDEVYETIASPDHTNEVLVPDAVDFAVQQESHQLMEELRAALVNRATDFAARERRALAAFYGVSDDELERIENAYEKNEPISQEFSSNDVFDQETDDNVSIEEALPKQSRTLPPDLLAALRLRAVAEQTIGDD
ncbi:hypothetical protein GCK32_005016 [Trichostrongylus colubriformis]|uniref:Uncharacterized protein n=1 Tax=Trichostrongylus colubriformis TaxID=6319 RepID=A0AAN8EWP6_TRICO